MNVSNNRKYYAVRIGREGPRLYDNYLEFAAATLGFSGSSGKGFDNIRDAQDWLTGYQFQGVFPTMTTVHNTNINLNVNVSGRTKASGTHAVPPTSIPPTNTTLSFDDEDDLEFPEFDLMQDISWDPDPVRVKKESFSPPPSQQEPSLELSDEQKDILKLVKSGRNIFFTGPAGTGKSVLLRAIIRYLHSVHGHGVAITAPTGIAGLNIGGQTIHSWAGIGLGKEPVERLRSRVVGDAKKRWIEAKALVIDEISMLDGRLFDKLEDIARFVREEDLPFGGIQLITSGDFFQLPPVPEQDSTSVIKATFAFQARRWHHCIDYMVKLNKVFRQKDDKFIDMLASMRTGMLTDSHIEQFQKLCREVRYDDGINPTQLFPLKAQVEEHNLMSLSKLQGASTVYKAMDSRGFDIYGSRLTPKQADKLLERLVCPKQIPLKVGAQVMLLRNMCQGLVNGSLGQVIEFISVHEAQKRHIEMADMERLKEGQVSPVVMPCDTKDSDTGSGLIALDNHAFKRDQLWPLVKFTNGRSLLCSPVEFIVEGLKGNIEARRLQIPLALSWAMSIHKSQGQTLGRVKVDLSRIFEKGQAYVAISRATCMEGLEILNFDPEKVMAHQDVIEWQKQWDKERYQEEEMDSDWAVSQWHDSFHE